MRKILFVFFIAFVVTQTSCLFDGNKISQLWFYSYSPHSNDIDSTITPTSFLNLGTDGSYTRDFGNFESGKWKQEGSILYLESKNGQMSEFQVKRFAGKQLQLINGKGTIINFESLPHRFSTGAEDPFSVENNRWRLRATKKESDMEIRARLKNHFRFYEMYFTWALDNQFQSIDVNSTPSPIKIYGNGFELKPEENLPRLWRAYFYDQEDCSKASAIIKGIFQQHDISWPLTENKFEMFISAFQQLQQHLR